MPQAPENPDEAEPAKTPPKPPVSQKEARRAAALKRNLGRRKAPKG